MDTIFALASAPGKAGVAVIRISGPGAFPALTALGGPDTHTRGLRVCDLTAPSGDALDQAVVLSFPKPNSFTGEDIVELQVHGSQSVIAACLSALGSLPDTRLADPGEFTRRALENGRLTLTQVEGLADLIDAETEAQRRQAQRVVSGDLAKRVETWRSALIRAAALIEATLDFADEDVPVDVSDEVRGLLSGVSEDLTHQVRGVPMAERVRSGFEVAIVGAPNAGKSTLLNALAQRPAALTSEIAGTPRDIVEVRMDLNGLPVTLLDTAGLRTTDDVVETLGIDRAIARAPQADLRVLLASRDADR